MTGGNAPAAEAPTPTEAAEATPDTDESHLRHEPALDGLRGLAVACVVAFHLGRLQGGFLGVDLFFILSGYLITSLLCDEWRRAGRIDLARFWTRRARRLLPALFLFLAGVSVMILTLTPRADRGRLRAEGLATIFYYANWNRVRSLNSYWDLFTVPSPFHHTWSLAIEEQFYLVWPLIFVAVVGLTASRFDRWRSSIGALKVVTAVAATASFCLLGALYKQDNTNRAYFGTDTRVGAILLGALLAMYAPARLRLGRRWLLLMVDVAGLGALCFMLWSVASVSGTTAWYYRGGLLTFAIAGLVVIAASVHARSGILARVLSLSPLAALGRISYGVYLWHWPMIVYLTPGRTGLGGLRLGTLRVVATMGLSVLSAKLVERPIRAGRLVGTPARISAVAATLIVVGTVVTATTADRGAESEAQAGLKIADPTTPITVARVPAKVDPTLLRILVVGDSGPLYLHAGFSAVARAHHAIVISQGEHGCSVLVPEQISRLLGGATFKTPPRCDQRLERWRHLLSLFRPQVVLYYLAYGGDSGEARLHGQWVTDCDPSFDRYLEKALTQEIGLLSANGARVALTTTPYTKGFSPADVAAGNRHVDCRNRTYRRVVHDNPRVPLLDLNRFVTKTEQGATYIHADFTHLSPLGGRLAGEWLLPKLRLLASQR